MIREVSAICAFISSAWPAALFCVNLSRYRRPERTVSVDLPRISVLIPARNEEHSIGAALESVLGNSGASFEVLVMDDASADRTAEIVLGYAARDPRVRLLEAPALPIGWNGKQHACFALARKARHDVLCFIDADVRLEPEALSSMAGFMESSAAALVSGFPRQVTVTPMEWLLLPLIHFVLLGFLPMGRMRSGTDPAYAAGCGQFLMVRREAYLASGAHAAIRGTMHDGLRLPKLLRQHGFRTDLADLTRLARCRMYTDVPEVWSGLAKNAIEGLGAPVRIVPITALLLAGQVLPFVLLAWFARHGNASRTAWIFAADAVACAWLPRVLAVRRFQQPIRGALLHPVGILLLLAVQWYALGRRLLGRSVTWKQRAYAPEVEDSL